MVQAFNISVADTFQCAVVILELTQAFPDYNISFDFLGHNAILRVEAANIEIMGITAIVEKEGYNCEQLFS
jgi:hypothetical protein